MAKSLKTLARPDAGALRELAASDPSIPPAVMPNTGSEVVNFRVASSVVDQLDAAADAEGTTRKVIITRALAKAGFRIPQPDLEDRTTAAERPQGSCVMADQTATTEARQEGFYWVVLGQNPPEIAYWDRREWWLAGDARPWQPEAVTVASARLVFKPQLVPVA